MIINYTEPEIFHKYDHQEVDGISWSICVESPEYNEVGTENLKYLEEKITELGGYIGTYFNMDQEKIVILQNLNKIEDFPIEIKTFAMGRKKIYFARMHEKKKEPIWKRFKSKSNTKIYIQQLIYGKNYTPVYMNAGKKKEIELIRLKNIVQFGLDLKDSEFKNLSYLTTVLSQSQKHANDVEWKLWYYYPNRDNRNRITILDKSGKRYQYDKFEDENREIIWKKRSPSLI